MLAPFLNRVIFLGMSALFNTGAQQYRVRLLAVVLPVFTCACSLDDINRLAYETGTQYVCNEQQPNLPDQVRECQASSMSYDAYRAARAETLSDN